MWLDEARTSAFRFYQFWLNTDDRDVALYLRFFTLLDRETIEGLEAATREAPERRESQRLLAREVTRLVHGEQALARAERASTLLFGERITELNVDEVLAVFADVPSTEWPAAAFGVEGVPIADLLVKASLAASKSEAMRLVKGGGVYVNNRRVTDERGRITAAQAIGGELFVVRKGQRQQHLVRLLR